MAFILITTLVFIAIPIASLFFASDSRFTGQLPGPTRPTTSDHWLGDGGERQR